VMHRTHPRCPAITRINFHCGCHFGFGIVGALIASALCARPRKK
jgi:hypothetical protein